MRRAWQARAGQASIDALPGAADRIRPRGAPQAAQRPGKPRQPGAHAGAKRDRQRLPITITESQPVCQVELFGKIETDDVVLPPGVECVPGLERGGQPGVVAQQTGGTAAEPVAKLQQLTAQSVRCDHGRRVGAQPAAPGQPHFRPGMSVGLPHQQITADRIPFATLVAGDDPRRHTARAHQVDECRGVVTAESRAGAEQEFIDRIAPQPLRRERIDKAAITQISEGVVDEGSLVCRLRAQLECEFACPRIASRRQRQVDLPCLRCELIAAHCLRVSGEFVGARLQYRSVREQLVVGGLHHGRGVRRPRHLQRHHRAVRVGLESLTVVIGGTAIFQRAGGRGRATMAAPGKAVEIAQHRTAPIALHDRGQWTGEPRAQRRLVGFDQPCDSSRAHLFAQSRDRLVIAVDRPEGPGQAWEEQETHDRQRQRAQQLARGFAQQRSRREQCAAGEPAERRRTQPQAQGVHRQAPELLPVQAGREQQEQRRPADHIPVAARACLEELGGSHRHQQRGAGGQPVEGSEAQ